MARSGELELAVEPLLKLGGEPVDRMVDSKLLFDSKLDPPLVLDTELDIGI